MKVYRVEHKDSKDGPYSGGALRSMDRYNDARKCPSPVEDGMYGLSLKHHFGFMKLRQLFLWFRARDIFLLRKRGFRVYRYKIKDEYVIKGEKQLAFVRSKATVREEVKMSLMVRHLCSF